MKKTLLNSSPATHMLGALNTTCLRLLIYKTLSTAPSARDLSLAPVSWA